MINRSNQQRNQNGSSVTTGASLDEVIRKKLLNEVKVRPHDLHYSDLYEIRDVASQDALKTLVDSTLKGRRELGDGLLKRLYHEASQSDRALIKNALLQYGSVPEFTSLEQRSGKRFFELLREFGAEHELKNIGTRLDETPDEKIALRYDNVVPELIAALERQGEKDVAGKLIHKLHSLARKSWHSPADVQFLFARLAVIRCEESVSRPEQFGRTFNDAIAVLGLCAERFITESYINQLARLSIAAFTANSHTAGSNLVERIIATPDPNISRDDWDQSTYKPAALISIANTLLERGLVVESNWVAARAWESGVQATFNAIWHLSPNPLSDFVRGWRVGITNPDALPPPPSVSLAYQDRKNGHHSLGRKDVYNSSIVEYIETRTSLYFQSGNFEAGKRFLASSITPDIAALPHEHLPRGTSETIKAIGLTDGANIGNRKEIITELLTLNALYWVAHDWCRLPEDTERPDLIKEMRASAERLEKLTPNSAVALAWMPILAAHLHGVGADDIAKEFLARQSDQAVREKMSEALNRRPWIILKGALSNDLTWDGLVSMAKEIVG